MKNETGLTAISSKLGWLLNGPINNDDENVQGFNKKSGHTLFVETNYDEDKLLSNDNSTSIVQFNLLFFRLYSC